MVAARPITAAARVFPVVGDALAFRTDKLSFLLQCSRKADVVELKLGRMRTYLLNDPSDIRHVLVTEEPRCPKNPRLTAPAESDLFGDGLVGSSEAEHRAKRLSLQPVFQQRQLDAFSDVILRCTDELADTWTSRPDVDLVEASAALAHRIRIRVLLGEDADDIAGELVEALTVRQQYIRQAFVSALPYADRAPSRARRRYRRAQRHLEQLLFGLIEERRLDGGAQPDLLGYMLEMRAEDGTAVGDQRVFDEARGFLASYALAAGGLAWALYLLAEHRDVQSALARELDSTLASGSTVSPGEALGFPQMVYSEALRLYPPTWLFVRVAPEDVRLPSGRIIPAGSRMFLCPYTSHRDPRFFPDPERFDPERFRPGPATRARPRSAYFPFGGGRHVCIGEGFVRLEGALVLSRLVRRFELTRGPGARAVPAPDVTLEQRGAIRLQLRERSPRPDG